MTAPNRPSRSEVHRSFSSARTARPAKTLNMVSYSSSAARYRCSSCAPAPPMAPAVPVPAPEIPPPPPPPTTTLPTGKPNASLTTSTSRAMDCNVRVRWSSPDCCDDKICAGARGRCDAMRCDSQAGSVHCDQSQSRGTKTHLEDLAQAVLVRDGPRRRLDLFLRRRRPRALTLRRPSPPQLPLPLRRHPSPASLDRPDAGPEFARPGADGLDFGPEGLEADAELVFFAAEGGGRRRGAAAAAVATARPTPTRAQPSGGPSSGGRATRSGDGSRPDARHELGQPRPQRDRVLSRPEGPQRGREAVRRGERVEVRVQLVEKRLVLQVLPELQVETGLDGGEAERERRYQAAGSRQRLIGREAPPRLTHRSGSGFSLAARSHASFLAPSIGFEYSRASWPAGTSL